MQGIGFKEENGKPTPAKGAGVQRENAGRPRYQQGRMAATPPERALKIIKNKHSGTWETERERSLQRPPNRAGY